MSLTGKAVKIVMFGLATTLLALQPFRAEAGTGVSCQWEPGGTVITDGQASEADPIRVCEFYDDGLGGYDPGGGGDGAGEYGGGGGGDSFSNEQMCGMLLAARPSGCPQPVASPSGYNYGSYGGVIGLMQRYIADQNARGAISNALRTALSQHTSDIARGLSFPDANAQFRTSLGEVCGTMLQDFFANSDPSGDYVSRAITNQFCLSALPRFDQEASGQLGFINWVMNDYSNVGFVDYTDIPWSGTLQNAIGFDNSLLAKYSEAAKDASCYNFWNQMGRLQCAG